MEYLHGTFDSNIYPMQLMSGRMRSLHSRPEARSADPGLDRKQGIILTLPVSLAGSDFTNRFQIVADTSQVSCVADGGWPGQGAAKPPRLREPWGASLLFASSTLYAVQAR